jgi:hypothetical protein
MTVLVGWPTVGDLCAQVGLPDPDPGDLDPQLVDAITAATAWALDRQPALRAPGTCDAAAMIRPDHRAGILALAAHLYRTRNSPSGVPDGFGGYSGDTEMVRVRALLGLGRHGRMAVG